MDVVLSLSGGLYRVQGLEGKKPLLEIRQEMITNHSLPYTKICLYTLTSPRSRSGSGAVNRSVANGQTAENSSRRADIPRSRSGSVMDYVALRMR